MFAFDRRDLAEHDDGLAGLSEACDDVVGAIGGDDNDHAIPQLKVRSISRSRRRPRAPANLNTGSTGKRSEIDANAQSFGSTRGMLSVKPPPVMCASA